MREYPAGHADERSVPEGQFTQVGNIEIEAGMVTPRHADIRGTSPATSLPLTVTMHGPDRRRLQAVAGGRVTESSGGAPRYGSISTRASWPVQPWLRVEEGRSAVSTLGLP